MPSVNPYGRMVSVEIEPVNETKRIFETSFSFASLSDGSRETLGVKFHVEQTVLGLPGFSEIHFYNLSIEKRTVLLEPGLRLRLKVGHGNVKLQEIYSGGIIRSFTRRIGADFVTTVYCHTFITQFVQSKETVTFAAYMPMVEILKSLCTKLGAKWDESRVNIPSDLRINSGGFSFAGKIEDILTKLALQYGFSWSILPTGVFQVLKDATSFQRHHIVSYKNGNLLTAIPMLEGRFKIMNSVQVKAFLNPAVWAGDYVTIESEINPFLNKDWLIHNLAFNGSTIDNEWTMNLDCKIMNPQTDLWGSY